MDISTLKNLAAYTPSLADYLGKGKTGYFDTIAQGALGGTIPTALRQVFRRSRIQQTTRA